MPPTAGEVEGGGLGEGGEEGTGEGEGAGRGRGGRSGDFTTVEMNAIERTLNNSCSQNLACKRDSSKLKSMFSKNFSSG